MKTNTTMIDMKGEVWKDVAGFEGLYSISNMGRVKSQGNFEARKTKMLKPQLLNTGYLIVKLSKQGKVFQFLVHRLVAEAFVPNPENKPEVNHLNELKNDNRACNLAWVTRKENINYGTRTQR